MSIFLDDCQGNLENEVNSRAASHTEVRVGETLEHELQRQCQCFEELYRIAMQQHLLLQRGEVDQLLSAKREKERLMTTIRFHTERLAELHADWIEVQGEIPAETHHRITEKVRHLGELVHHVLDLEKKNFEIVRSKHTRARDFLKGTLPPSEQPKNS
jgi:flagellar biosynthesis/type III secretory pathway chaperone